MTPQPTMKPAPASEPGRHSIRIEVKEGKLVYTGSAGKDATNLTVKPGDTVVWHSDHGNYSVLFKSKSPFQEVAYHGHRGTPTNHAIVVGEKDKYHYAVTVIGEDNQPIVDDPVIIVNDGD